MRENGGTPERCASLQREANFDSHFGKKGQLREALLIKGLATARPDGCNVKDIHFPAVY